MAYTENCTEEFEYIQSNWEFAKFMTRMTWMNLKQPFQDFREIYNIVINRDSVNYSSSDLTHDTKYTTLDKIVDNQEERTDRRRLEDQALEERSRNYEDHLYKKIEKTWVDCKNDLILCYDIVVSSLKNIASIFRKAFEDYKTYLQRDENDSE